MWGRFGEPDATELAKRNSVLAQFDFEIERMRARTKQHGDFAQRHTLLAQFSDALRDKLRLFVFVMGTDDHGRFTVIKAREEPLLVAFLHLGHERIGDIQNGLRAAEVLLQLDYLRRGKKFRKLQHVSMSRAAK